MLDKHSKHLLLFINEHKQLTVTMATKEDICYMFKFYKMKNTFEPPTFGGKTCQNAKNFLSSFNNYCKLNRIHGQEKKC